MREYGLCETSINKSPELGQQYTPLVNRSDSFSTARPRKTSSCIIITFTHIKPTPLPGNTYFLYFTRLNFVHKLTPQNPQSQTTKCTFFTFKNKSAVMP